MGTKLDIGIAGCGIGGLSVATMLARDGHRVTLFERFAEPGPVGSGLMLQPTGIAILQTLGLAEQAIALGARIDRLHGTAGKRTVLDVSYSALNDQAFGLGIHRSALFDILFRAARESAVTVVAGREVQSCNLNRDKRHFGFADGGSDGPFDLAVDACGCRSPLVAGQARPLPYGALWTEVDDRSGAAAARTLSQRYRRASQMAGLLPIGVRTGETRPRVALFWSIRDDQVEQLYADGIEAWRAKWSELWPEAADYARTIDDLSQLTLARYAHRTLRCPVEQALFHLGDAWHSTSPQLGQGANTALLDAYALANALRSTGDIASALDQTLRSRRLHVWLYQWMSLLLTGVYQSDSRIVPLLRDWLMGPLSHLYPLDRMQAAMVAGTIGGPLHRLGLTGNSVRAFTAVPPTV